MKPIFKRMLSGVLSAVIALSATPIVSAYAEKGEEYFTYCTDDYTVTYSVTNNWSSNYQGSVKIFNNSDKIIHDWSLAYVNDLETTQIWNANAEVYNSIKFVRNAGYNQDILPNESVEFGFIGTSDNMKIPEKFQLISAPSYVDPSDFSASFTVLNNWGTGYTAALTLTNETNRIIEDWFIDFEWDSQVDTVWNAVLLEQNGSHFVMGNSSYNQNIEPGQSVTICLQSNNINGVISQPYNISVQEYGLARNNAINDLLNVRDISIDTSKFPETDENSYYVVDEIDSISGSIRPGLIAVSADYTIENAWGKVISSGSFEPDSNWTIPNIGLVIGNNRVTVNTVFNDGTEATNSKWLFNLAEENVRNIDIDLNDSDGDGLDNYCEEIYGTNPELPDTDGDDLTDYQELAETGTNPLIVDSNNDGITDGHDDYDRDSIDTITEYSLGTNPFCIDSDYDELTDYEELYIYNTNPLINDTDEDSAKDGWEIINNYNPLVPDDFFQSSAIVDGVGTSAEINVKASDGSVSSLTAEAIGYTPYLNAAVPGYMGSGFDINMDGDFVSAELKITFDELFLEDDNLDPVIYYYNEETGELEEVYTEWDGTSNYVTAKLEHFSKYILLNRVDFNEIFERDFELPEGTDVRPYEFVFIIDSSGSMKNNDPTNIRLEVAKSFVDKMGDDDKAQVMAFDKENYFYTSEFISDKTELKNAIDKIPNNGSYTYIGAAVSAGLELFSADYDGTRRYIILLTDGISHDTLPTNYEEIAETKQVQIITIGLGSGVSKSFLEAIATNTAPDNQNGLYYFASSASDLSETFTKIEKEVKKEDPYKDSNNDGITDAQTKLFCEGKLKTNTGINPFAGYTYEEIQNDTDGDLDDDGLINGEEVHLDKTTTNSRYVSMTSDPRDADYDRDGFNDAQEVKHNTSPYRFNMLTGDVQYLTRNEQYLASSYSDDYIHSKALKAQLAAGNALFRFKLKYTQDYEIALSNYFVTAAKVLSGPELEEELRSTMLDYLTSKTSEFSDWLSDRYTFDGILNPVLAQKTVALADKQTQLCLTGWEWVIAVRDLTHDLESGAVTLEECVNNFADINNKYRPLMEELSPKGIKDVLSLDFLFDDLESMPVPASTGKFAQCIKVGGKVMEVGGYVLIGAKGAVNSYNAVASIAAYASIDDQYERSEYLMEAIMEHSDIDEMCDAASNLKKVIEGERSEYVELVSPILSSLAEGGKTYLVNAIVNGSSKFSPWVFAIDAGLAVGDFMWNISDIDEASLAAIALGDAATCLSEQIRINLSYYENSDYSVLDNDDIAMINNLAQLRICAEDEFMIVMDNYPKLFNLIHKVLAGDWLVDATEEACEGNINCIIQIMDQSPLLVAVKHYDE